MLDKTIVFRNLEVFEIPKKNLYTCRMCRKKFFLGPRTLKIHNRIHDNINTENKFATNVYETLLILQYSSFYFFAKDLHTYKKESNSYDFIAL